MSKTLKVHNCDLLQIEIKHFPKVKEFIKEALEINSLLSKKHSIFCKQIIEISPSCKEVDALVSQFTDAKVNFEEIHEKIANLIT